jgi:hypothetical protein
VENDAAIDRLQKNMVVIAQRSLGGTSTIQQRAALSLKIDRLFTHNKKRSSYAILNTSLGEAYHLHEL